MVKKRAAGFLIYRLVSSQIEYLLLKASYGDFHFSPPKGHVDPGEDDYTTALRETREETGYTEKDLKIHKNLMRALEYEVRAKKKVVIYYLAELLTPADPVLSDEHTEFQFVVKDDVKKIAPFPDFLEMLESFDADIRKLHQL